MKETDREWAERESRFFFSGYWDEKEFTITFKQQDLCTLPKTIGAHFLDLLQKDLAEALVAAIERGRQAGLEEARQLATKKAGRYYAYDCGKQAEACERLAQEIGARIAARGDSCPSEAQVAKLHDFNLIPPGVYSCSGCGLTLNLYDAQCRIISSDPCKGKGMDNK